MRIRWTSVLAMLAVAAAIVGFFAFRPDDSPPAQPDPAPTTPSQQPAPPTVDPPAPTAEDSHREVPESVRDFITAYAAVASDDAQWVESLRPLTTSALYGSLLTSDRSLALDAGEEVLEAEEGRVAVGAGGRVTYVLTYALLSAEMENDGAPQAERWVVTGIDFTAAPEGAALPLGSAGVEQLREPVQRALTAVVAQPGGMTDAQRQEAIRGTFSDPQDALGIPRAAGEETAIRIGNIHELVAVEEQGEFVVHATVPYAPDGEDTPEWVTVTIVLARGENGGWVPQDARL